MTARLQATVRILRRVVSWLAAALFVLIVAASFAAYRALSGHSMPVLRTITTSVGRLVAGQRTEQMTLDVQVMPKDGRIAATATLSVRNLEDKRQRFYFLLNDGLKIRNLRVAGVDTTVRRPAAYQLWLLTVVDVGSPVTKGDTVQLTFDYDGNPAAGLFGAASNLINAQQLLLNVDTFWYPFDAQSFFTADITVTLPRSMTLVHNGVQASRTFRGELQRVHWTSERPIGGLSLVAGPYALTTRETDGVTYRLHLADDVQLDAQRILRMMTAANRTLEQRFGPSGFKQLTLFVSREFRRGFNDGSGLMGLSIRYFRVGDYGFATTAHEIAHNWWGGTVAEKWLTPGTGGEWIVEGFAEFSSLVAAEAEFGAEALARRLAGEFFDPARQAAIADMSVLDNALNESVARDTIYRKGAYVASLLRRVLGDDAYFTALRQFLERFRYQQATDRDLQHVLQEASGQDLERFFADWVRSDHLADLSLDAVNTSQATVSNLGTAFIPGEIEVWTFKKGGGEPARSTVRVGDQVSLDADTDYVVVDPTLAWADMQRENNRYPRRNDPVYVSTSSHEALAITHGEAWPWVRADVASVARGGHTDHTWDFERGVLQPPAWSADAAYLVVSSSDAQASLPAIVTLAADGTRRTIGRGTAPAVAADGSIYAAKQDRIVRLAADGAESTLVTRRGATLDQPVPAPDGTRVVYTAANANHLELRAVEKSGGDDRLVLSWDRDRLISRWSPDGSRLYTVVGGNWDWQVWEIPLNGDAVQVLVKDAAAIADLAVSPDGTHLAFTAAPELDYPTNRRQLFVMHLGDHNVRTIDLPDADLTQLTWEGPASILVVAAAARRDQPCKLPEARSLRRVSVVDGSVEEVH